MQSTAKRRHGPRFIALLAAAMIVSIAAPASAGGAFVDRIDGPFETVVPVA